MYGEENQGLDIIGQQQRQQQKAQQQQQQPAILGSNDNNGRRNGNQQKGHASGSRAPGSDDGCCENVGARASALLEKVPPCTCEYFVSALCTHMCHFLRPALPAFPQC